MSFDDRLVDIINEEGIDAEYNLSDRVIANYLISCLDALDNARRKQDDIENDDNRSDPCKYCKAENSEHAKWCPSREMETNSNSREIDERCGGCKHSVNRDDGYCYMFKDKPRVVPCGQHDKYKEDRKLTADLLNNLF